MSLKIATWNLCLGLPNKKDVVLRELESNNIDVCCMQETELEKNYPVDILSTPIYEFESEKNTDKKRIGIYVNRQLNYNRREDLEESDSHVIILDIKSTINLRIISLYRSFRPPNGMSPRSFFEKQLNIVERNCLPNTIVLGDFNLDFKMKWRNDYPHKHLFTHLTELTDRMNLLQLVDFPTWSRYINNIQKTSILDHVYVNNLSIVNNCGSITPTFGDHLLIILELTLVRPTIKNITRRNWRNYSKQILVNALNPDMFEIDCIDVQQYWNEFENTIINVIDKILPIETTCLHRTQKTEIPNTIRTKINQRKKILKKYKLQPSFELKTKIKILDKAIKTFFHSNKSSKIRNKIVPGDNKSLWSAVKLAKNLPLNAIPKNCFLNNEPVNDHELPNCFANFFQDKVQSIKDTLQVSENVYNGKNKIIVCDRFFMNGNDIKECIMSLKRKKCEGFDRIPVSIIIDSIDIILPTLTKLFKLIYDQKKIPDQWKMAKIVPIFKKGNKSHIENYRPIANQCSTSKVFEKLILKQIHYLESTNNLDFTCKQQHGLKKSKSTATVSILLHSLIVHATDSDNYALMALILLM